MHRSMILVLGLLFLGSCASFSLSPVTPPSPTAVSAVTVEYDAALAGKKAKVLDRYDMKTHMSQALMDSFQGGEGQSIRVTITQFRTGGYGPTRMHAKAQLMDASGRVVTETEADSTSLMGSVQGVAQEVVNKLAAGF